MTNPLAYVFWLPFVAIPKIVIAYLNLPWQFIILIALAIALLSFILSLNQAGPFRVAALARRFSWTPIALIPIFIFWTWCAFMWWTDPSMSTTSVFVSAVFLELCWFLLWFWHYVVKRGHGTYDCIPRAYRRMRFRLRWDSIAKSCGMSHTKDVRPKGWTTGGTATNILGAARVQWVATLWHGRRAQGDATTYWIKPARGQTFLEVQRSMDAIALAADAHSCFLSDIQGLKFWKGWKQVTVFWSNPAANRPTLQNVNMP